MKTITFFNNKGGVGKTTTIVNIGSFLSKKVKKKILILDLDPQSNSTQLLIKEENWMEYYGKEASRVTVLNYFDPLIRGDASIDIHEVPIKKDDNSYSVDLIPGHPKLSIIEDILSDSWGRCLASDIGGFRRTNWLNALKKHFNDSYDLMLIDVGPSLGALNRSVLLNTDYFITPMGSDIFSLLGIDNIDEWISRWRKQYSNSLENLPIMNIGIDLKQAEKDYLVNINIDKTTRFIGFSIQQYSKRKFKEGPRPVQAYERVIKDMPESIIMHLGKYVPKWIAEDELNLGDMPYVYSLVPLSQTAKVPMFDLNYSNGIRGNQSASVEEYSEYIELIVNNLVRNLGNEEDDKITR